jgi:hypothetical protein
MCSQHPEKTFQMVGIHFDSVTGQILNKKVVDIDTKCPEPFNACMDKFFHNMEEDEKIKLMTAIQTDCVDTEYGIYAKFNTDSYLFVEI